MKKLLTFFYNISSTILGFLEHPYSTMQKVVEARVPLAFIFFPLLFCVIGWAVAHFLAGLFLSILPLFGLWWFLEVWWLTFWGLWQITLIYLFWRFSSK
ncbi:MAG TPA: hypothetical protein VLH19_04510 [Patescibacteria group bacterium]|nr:hypothetical protein [Patescibacteria group bacterium]